MKLISQLVLTLFFVVTSINVAQAIDAAPVGENVIGDIALQGGSNSEVVWSAPFTKTYKVYVKVPATGTVANAQYRVYPKGKLPDSIACSSIDIDHPCFDLIVDQTQHLDSWVQLMLNNNVETSWDFIEHSGFVAAIAGNLNPEETLNLSASVKFEEVLSLTIGDTYQNGIIFYIDATGRHGKIAAPIDQNTIGTEWQNAVRLSADLVIGAYDDWYLPSRTELNLMYLNIGPGAAAPLTNIGGFLGIDYWSSTLMHSGLTARGQDFSTGRQNNYGRFGKNYVRAVRAF